MLSAAALLEILLFIFPIKIFFFPLIKGVNWTDYTHLIYIQAHKTIVSISTLLYG